MPLQCPWMWRRQPILPHPLPSIHARAAVTLHDARGIPTRLVNPITLEDTRDSGSCFAAGLDERGIPTARGGKWSAVQVARLIGKRLLTAATFVLDFQRAGQAAARAGEARTMFQGSSWSMRLIG